MLIVLDSPNRKLVADQSSMGMVNCNVTVTYADHDGSSFIEGTTPSTLDGMNKVVILDSPASGVRRVIKSITFYNSDDMVHEVGMYLRVTGGMDYPIVKIQLPPKGSWSSDDQTGVNVGALTNGDKGDIVVTDSGQQWTLKTVNANVGQFGSTTNIPVVTVNAKGLVTAVSTAAISIPPSSLNFTGEVTGNGSTGGNTALTITNKAVTYAKIQDVSDTNKLLGRSSLGAGSIEEITCTPVARNFLAALDAAAQRTVIGAGTVTSVSGTGTVNGLTLSGSGSSSVTLTLGGTLSNISLTSQVTGTLPVANGGTGATTAAGALTSLGAAAVTSTVVPSANSGTGSIGTSTEAARADHVHPASAGGGSGNGFKNYLINGDFRIAQRGTLINSTSIRANNNDASYTLDRWYLLSDGNNIVTVARSATAPTPGLNSMALQVVTAAKKFGIAQVVESVNCYPAIGETVTLSFKARVSSTANISNVKAAIITWSGTADSITRDIISAWNTAGTSPTLVANWTVENTTTPVNLNVTTSWATYSVTGPIDTVNAKNIGVFIWCDALPAATGDTLFIADVQLEVGSAPTSFEILPLNVQELNCLRYFESINSDTGAYNTMAGVGYCKIAGRFDFPISYFKVKKRIHPTMTASGPTTFGADISWLYLDTTVNPIEIKGRGASLYFWTSTQLGADTNGYTLYLFVSNWATLPVETKFSVGSVGYCFANGRDLPAGQTYINASAEL